MTRTDFINGLRDGLQGEVSPAVIQESVSYYDRYISDEIASGKTEEQVLEELGSVRLIVKSILEAQAGAEKKQEEHRQQQEREERREQRRESRKPRFHLDRNKNGKLQIKFGEFVLNSWYGITLAILLVLLLIAIIVALIIGAFLLAWKLLPVILIGLLVLVVALILIRVFSKPKE